MTEYIVDWNENLVIDTFSKNSLRNEIVRCRDCKYYTYADAEHENNDWCAKHEHIAWSVNGFCAWGRRGES